MFLLSRAKNTHRVVRVPDFCDLGLFGSGQLDVLHIVQALLALADEGNVLVPNAGDLRELNLLNGRQTNWKNTFNTYTIRDFADSHGLASFRATHLHNDPFVDLNTLFFFAIWSDFLDLLVDTNRHPGADLGSLDNGWEGNLVGHRWRQE